MNDDLKSLAERFAGQGVIRRILFHESVDSTNNVARELARADPASAGCVVLADQQTKGKGRSGRSWISPPGTGLWMSLILDTHTSPEKFYLINQICSLSIAQTVQYITPGVAELKWPNDVLVEKRKVAGVLLETLQVRDRWKIIAGIGINVNQTAFPDELQEVATSLRLISGQIHNRANVLEVFLHELSEVHSWSETELLRRWKDGCKLWGKEVKISRGSETFVARVIDLADDGGLKIERDLREEIIYAADVSLRL